jgi:nicotinamidase-related amidase
VPDSNSIDRLTVNPWEDNEFREAVVSTGRRKLIMCGLWTEVVHGISVLDAISEGFEVYAVSDAIGGSSADADERAMQLMIQAGTVPIMSGAVWAELQRDHVRETAQQAVEIFRQYHPTMQGLADAA